MTGHDFSATNLAMHSYREMKVHNLHLHISLLQSSGPKWHIQSPIKKMDPNKDIPRPWWGRYVKQPKATRHSNGLETTTLTCLTRCAFVTGGTAGIGFGITLPIFSSTMAPRPNCYRAKRSTPMKRQKSPRSMATQAGCTGSSVIGKP